MPDVEVVTHGQIVQLARQRFQADHGTVSAFHLEHGTLPADPEGQLEVLQGCPICEGTNLHYLETAYAELAPDALDPTDPTTTAQASIRRRARELGWSWD